MMSSAFFSMKSFQGLPTDEASDVVINACGGTSVLLFTAEFRERVNESQNVLNDDSDQSSLVSPRRIEIFLSNIICQEGIYDSEYFRTARIRAQGDPLRSVPYF